MSGSMVPHLWEQVQITGALQPNSTTPPQEIISVQNNVSGAATNVLESSGNTWRMPRMPSGLDSSTLHRMVDEGILSKENIFDEPPRYKNARTNQDIPQLFSYPLSLGGVAEVMTDQAAREKISSIWNRWINYPVYILNIQGLLAYAEYIWAQIPTKDKLYSILASTPGTTMDEKMQSLGIPFCGYFGTGSKKKFIGVGSEVRLVYQIDPDELVYGTLRIQKTDITISEKVSPTFLDRGYSAIFVR